MTNQDYKNAALAALRGNWTPAVVASFVFLIVAAVLEVPVAVLTDGAVPAFSAVNGITYLGAILLLLPLEVGLYWATYLLLKDGDANITQNMFSCGFSNYIHVVLGMFLMGILCMLGIFCLIIPGIYLAFSYALVPYLLIKNPELSLTETLKTSRMMMKGHKLDYFLLCLSFIGWIFLSIFTLGLGLLWLLPYMQTTYAAFWEDIRSQYEQE